MSNELDKLAAEMRKIKPSKHSRQNAMNAAMSAFDQAFSAESKTAQINETLEKNIDVTQGLTVEPRPTGQKARDNRVQTFGRDTMSKFSSLLNFKPQTMMMAGSCAAALIAGLIIVPNMGELGMDSAVVSDAETVAPSTSVKTAPALQQGDASADKSAELKLTETTPATGPRTITRQRRVLKTPARTAERAVPAKTSTITRRVVKTPASTSERTVPAITKQETRRIEKADGSFETVSETVIVQEASTELVETPAEYMNVTETVVAQEASSELVSIPAVYETVTETVTINADGTETLLSSEVVPQVGASTPQGGINSIDSLLSDIRNNPSKVETENRQRVRAFKQREVKPGFVASQNPRLNAARTQGAKAPTPGRTRIVLPGTEKPASATPLPKSIGGLTVDEVTTKSVVPNTNKRGQFTVFNGVTNEVVQSTETIVSQTGEILCRVLIPAKYKTITKQVVVVPPRTEEVTVPAVTKEVTVKRRNDDGSFRDVVEEIVIKEAMIDYIITPAVYETRSERILIEPAREEWKPDSQAINAQAINSQVVTTSKIYLRDDDGNVVREFKSRDAFEIYKANLPTPVDEKPVSTFSVDVDTASYSFLRASINRGQLPPPSAIRLEELINYFPYDYDAPKSADEPFKANVTVTPNPWNPDTKLMHIGIKGYVPKQTEKPRSNLVFLIDTSGSMNRANKLPLLINSFKLLLNTLDEDDTVSIVAYASASGTVLEPTAVKNKSEILAALNNLRAGGSTAGAAGLELAYQKAQESFDDEGVNRVILATDGDFNVGFSSPDDMKKFIQKKRKTGIFLSVLGFGMGNYNDHLMQSLAQNGNGVAAYIDNLSEANKVLANEAGSALFTIAKDVKIQVEFNPSEVAEYRLIGYETRALKRQDFNNDKVDAGEIGAGHSVTAIYEMTPVDSPAVTVDKLRYVAEKLKLKKTDEYAFVKIRHKLPNADKSTLQTFPVGKRKERSLKRASDDMRFAAAVAIVGQKLRGDEQVEDYSYADAIKLAVSAKGDDKDGYRAEFIQMVKLIDSMDE